MLSPIYSLLIRLAASILLLAGGCLAGPYVYHHGHYGLGPVARTRGLGAIGVTSAQVRLESSSGVSGTLYIEQVWRRTQIDVNTNTHPVAEHNPRVWFSREDPREGGGP